MLGKRQIFRTILQTVIDFLYKLKFELHILKKNNVAIVFLSISAEKDVSRLVTIATNILLFTFTLTWCFTDVIFNSTLNLH